MSSLIYTLSTDFSRMAPNTDFCAERSFARTRLMSLTGTKEQFITGQQVKFNHGRRRVVSEMCGSERSSYSRRWVTKAYSETRTFTGNKLLASALMSIIVQAALWKFGKIHLDWSDLGRTLLIFAGSYVTAILGSFVVNFFRAPALLDGEYHQELIRLSLELELPDKAEADYLRGLIAKLSDSGKAVLQFALLHEEITNKQLSTVLPSWEDVQKGYRECLDQGLLKWRNDCPDRTNPMIWAYDSFL